MKNLPNLDLIRSVAVLLVVVAHTTLYAGHYPDSISWLGQAGVGIFFVHTTLVLMWSLERDPHTARFYVRRIFRIYPLWLVVLFGSLAVHIPTMPDFGPHFGFLKPPLRTIVANSFLLSDLGHGHDLVGAAWTLPVEVHMYIVLPFLFFLARKERRVWPLLVLDALAILFGLSNQNAPAPVLLRSVPDFIPGVIAYVRFKNSRPILPSWSFLLFFFPFVLLMCRYGSYHGLWSFCLVLAFALPLFHDIRAPWLKRTTHLIAKYSYGIYLGHVPAIAVGLYYLRGHSIALRAAGYLLVLCGLPVLLYHGIEKPMIRLGSRLAGHIGPGPEPPVDERTLSMEPAP